MKKINRTLAIGGALLVSGGLIAGLAVAAGFGESHGHGHRGQHGMIKPLKLDADNDGMLSQTELLSANVARFNHLDSDQNGTIDATEFNA